MAESKEKSRFSCVFGFSFFALLVLQVITILMITGVIPTKKDDHVICDHKPTDNGLEPITEPEEIQDSEISLSKTYFGTTASGHKVDKFTFVNKNGLHLEVLTLGGIISVLKVPCRHGHFRDIIAGYDKLENLDDVTKPAYYGAIIGRVANRIANHTFTVDGTTYHLNANDGNNHLHGGLHGWNKKIWKATQHKDHISLTYTSPDNDEGYPGEVKVTVTYQLTNDNEVIVNFTARAYKKSTPINLTSHGYFNLGGQSNRTICDHEVTIHADKYIVVNDELIPTGEQADVQGSLFDFRSPLTLGDRMHNVSFGGADGYDHAFVVRGPTGKRSVAKVYHPKSGRVMEVYSNQPGVQFYTGNFLNEVNGKEGVHYGQHTAFTMETQNFPDAVNQPSFPDSILRPGSIYQHQVWYKFSAE